MQVKQCRNCGKLFHSLGSPVCLECEEILDQQFRLVRDYLYNHPGADIPEIVQQTNVSERSILQFLREERLSMRASDMGGGLRCEQCGKSIPSGQLCVDCKEKLSKLFESKLEGLVGEKSTPDSSKPTKQGRRHFENNTW